tara:strand:+ start:2191 stop:2559 length:369 start_codon:yes stop_codon:yes gene_type:complete
MSIGNLKDQGNKGNNFPYQLRNLQILNELLIAANTQAVGVERFPNVIETTGRGDLSAYNKLYNVSFYNNSAGVIDLVINGVGVNLPAGVTLNYDAGLNNWYNGVNFEYVNTGTRSLIITFTT